MSFAVIYRWRIAAEHQEAFRQRWHRGTLHYREKGGLGSCLTRNEAGDFVAIALWPSEEARAAAFAGQPPPEPHPGILSFEEEKLWVEDDLWTISAFRDG